MVKWTDTTTKLWNQLEPSEKRLFDTTSSRFFTTLHHNGWFTSNLDEEQEDFSVYKLSIISDSYNCTIHAFICRHFSHMDFGGELGIEFLELEYEYEQPYSPADVQDMLAAFKYAEQNLVAIGIPFVSNYRFHQDSIKDTNRLIRLNKKNISVWGLDKLKILRDKAIEALDSSRDI